MELFLIFHYASIGPSAIRKVCSIKFDQKQIVCICPYMASAHVSTPAPPNTYKPGYLCPKPAFSSILIQCTNSKHVCYPLRIASTRTLMLLASYVNVGGIPLHLTPCTPHTSHTSCHSHLTHCTSHYSHLEPLALLTTHTPCISHHLYLAPHAPHSSHPSHLESVWVRQ